MKKTISKIAIAAVAAVTTITSMISISASANDGMTKEQSDAAAAAANAAADQYFTDSANGYDFTVDEYVTEPVETYDSSQKNILTSGTWYSMTPAGPRTYVFEYNAASGEYRDEYSDKTNYFTYDLNGSFLTLYNHLAGTTLYATVSYVDSDTIVISWDSYTETLKTTKAAAEQAAGFSNIFAQGNWYSVGMNGIKDYWFDSSHAQGSCTDEGTGRISYFSYDFANNRIVFYYDNNTTISGTVSYEGYDMIIAWDNGFSERLSTTYPTVNIDPVVTTVTTEEVKNNQYIIAEGAWVAESTQGVRTYVFGKNEFKGELCGFDKLIYNFDYTFDGSDLWLHIQDAAKGEHATVKFNTGNGTFTLTWASGLVETLTKSEYYAAPVTTPVVTSTVANTTVTTTKKTTTTVQAASTTANKSASTTATQAAKKAPASTDSPKTGDKFPVIALTVAALAAAAAGITASKKFSRK